MKMLSAGGLNRKAGAVLSCCLTSAGSFFRIFRKLNELYAKATGYFWMPCPLCGKMFGGHETGGTLWDNGLLRSGSVVCWRHDRSYFYKGTEIVEVRRVRITPLIQVIQR